MKSVKVQILAILLQLALLGCFSGCAAGNKLSTGDVGDTLVTTVATSSGNDRLSAYNVIIESLEISNSSGSKVKLLPKVMGVEFGRLNGVQEPLSTAKVPSGTYTSANITIGPSLFACYGGSPTRGIATGIYNYGYTPAEKVTLNLPSSIVVSGGSAVLSLSMDLAHSGSWATANCFDHQNTPAFSITPTFRLEALVASGSVPVAGLQGLVHEAMNAGQSISVTGMEGSGSVTAVGGDSEAYYAPTWVLRQGLSTAYEGVAGFSSIKTGTLVNFDGTLQSDGSVTITRLSVPDPDPSTISASTGPVVVVLSSGPVLATGSQAGTGTLFDGQTGYSPWAASFDNAQFLVSSEITNLEKLPFAAHFDGASLAAGQIVSITTHATSVQPAPVYLPAKTITLIPQTINGTVLAVGSVGDFTEYTVQLADYSMFPQLAYQALQTTVLKDPRIVVVYADKKAEIRNHSAITPGALARFHGAVFLDAGSLKMDCLWTADGVAE